MTRALITGATAGIGAEFARQLAASGHDLVLVARDEERLHEHAGALHRRFGVAVEALSADLLSPAGLSTVEARLRALEPPIDVLVNNAGFGLRGSFEENSIADEQRLLDLLVAAPMRLTHAALPNMIERGHGQIVNIASVAGFTPRGTYGASKAWVISFSRWANVKYAPQGVTVTAVAPGFVRTEFHARMKVSTGGIPAIAWLRPETVVRLALKDVAKGKAVSVPTIRYKIVVAVAKLLPARMSAAGDLAPHKDAS
ncbi:MAG TPA: SDR family oxidoreductase [Glaciihabitans sp.]|jgi:hypothetical protein|nr:SDR family oxidoreductase [Glaciihabitans sp.]